MGAHIGALVETELVLQRQDAALGIDRDAGMVMLLARVIGRHQMLAPVLDPFDRPAEPHRREADEKILRVELAADAEAAAGIAFLEHHGGRAAAEHAGERVAVAVRHLRGAVQFEHVARRIVARQGAARFERHAAMPADRQVERDDRVRRGEGGIDIAVFGAHDQRLGRNSGREAARRRARRRAAAAAPRPRSRPDRRRPRRDTGRSRTRPRPARRHSAAGPAPAAADDRGATPRPPGRENRSAADRRCPCPVQTAATPGAASAAAMSTSRSTAWA